MSALRVETGEDPPAIQITSYKKQNEMDRLLLPIRGSPQRVRVTAKAWHISNHFEALGCEREKEAKHISQKNVSKVLPRKPLKERN